MGSFIMRLLVSAFLAASVSFTAFAPAQACISACSSGGGGGSSASSTSSAGGSSESSESNIDASTGLDTSATAVYLDSLRFDASDPLVTLNEALAKLRELREAEADWVAAQEASINRMANPDGITTEAQWYDLVDLLFGFLDGRAVTEDAVDHLEGQIARRWGAGALQGV
jgi:hypothetical protein